MSGGASGRSDRDLDDLASRWPHVQREADGALLEHALQGGSVLLVGEAGVGKTVLAGWIRDALGDAGAHVLDVVASEPLADVPLGALRRELPPPQGTPVAQLLGWALQRAIAVAGGAPLVLGVDDAPHLDPVTAALVHQLVAGGHATAVVTARHDEPLPDALQRLQRDGFVRPATVEPLRATEVGPLLREALGGAATTSTVRALTAASGGNPLHLRELCAHGLDHGQLRQRAGSWTWDGPVRAAGRLRETLLERIAGLDGTATRAVELLAFAHVLGMEACEALVGTEVIDALERRRIVAVDRIGRRDEVRLAHPLFGEVVRDGCGGSAAEIQGQLADAVEAHGCRRATDLPRVAGWRLAAGQVLDPALLVAAATQASSSHDHQRAEQLALAAVAAGGGPMAALTLGAVLAEAGREREAEQHWSAIDLPPGDPLHVQLQLARAANLFFGLDRPAAAAALVDDATEQATTVAELEQIALQRAMLHLYEGRPAAAADAARPVVEHSDSAYRRRAAAVFLGPALAVGGRCEEAVAVLDRALGDAGDDSASINLTGELLAGRFLGLVLGGRVEESCVEARSLGALAAAMGVEKGVAVFALAAGHAALLLGRIDEALGELEDAAVLLRRLDRNGYLPWCLGELAHARVLGGDLDGAEAALLEAVGGRAAAFRLFDCRLDLARSRFTTAIGRVEDAERLALHAGRRAADAGQHPFAAQALHEGLRLRSSRRSARGVDELAAHVIDVASATDGPVAAALAAHAVAAQRVDGGALREAAQQLFAAGLRVHAAEALQLGSWHHLHTGRRAEALGCALGARTVASGCPGAAADWLGPLPALDILSERELDVALRAGLGDSDRTIAEELFVSVRTVENHLHRTYAKLDVRGRAELAACLRAAEWSVAHDPADVSSYVPPQPPRPLEVEWLRKS